MCPETNFKFISLVKQRHGGIFTLYYEPQPMRHSILVFIALLFISSCAKEEPGLPTGDYFIFGYYYDCPAESCVEYYKLEGRQLFEDLKDEYPEFGLEPELDFKELPESKYELVKDLPDYFPMALLDKKETVFGKPDEYNQGGLYVRVKKGNREGFWFFDKDPKRVGSEYQGFVQILNNRLTMISD